MFPGSILVNTGMTRASRIPGALAREETASLPRKSERPGSRAVLSFHDLEIGKCFPIVKSHSGMPVQEV